MTVPGPRKRPMRRDVTSWLMVLVLGIGQGAAAEPAAVDQDRLKEWVEALKDRDREASIKAARRWVDALGEADPAARKRAAVLLGAGLSHPSTEVRERAAEVLARIGPGARGSVPALAAMLSDEDQKVRWSAADVLGAFGPAAEAVGTASPPRSRSARSAPRPSRRWLTG